MATSAEAASFSPSFCSNPLWKYHVFLSFRGEDTRKGFTDHLYAALQRKVIITFKDDEELKRGEVISQELLRAIEESLSSIVILSPTYATSTWCLNELQKILESRKSLNREVFPVFYNVDPSDVRHQKGSFADAFKKHEERFSEDEVRRWRDALSEVANMSGFDSRGRHEAKLIEEIVEELWTKLQPKLPSYNESLIGIDSRMKEMISLLRVGLCDVRLIGIWGMGGIGKTTLARTVYERIRGQFDICCFIADVREISKGNGLVHLQRKLLSTLKLRSTEIDDSYEGKKIIRNLLCNRKVLVVLDDVSELSQLEKFSIYQAWLGPGSRVIVTTRDEHILAAHGEFEKYEAKFLNNDESLQLFCQRAFKRDKPTEDYLELSKIVVEFAAGLPLTLEVLGSHFCGRNILEWKDALEKIKKIPPDDILKRLRISYEGLDYMNKQIFLDIACFLKGMAKDQVTQILEICGLHPTIGIKELVEKCLLTEHFYDGKWCLGMHDILQDMGKSIVADESPSNAGRRSRLWSHDDIDYVLTKNKGSELIEVIHFQTPKPYEARWDAEVFSKMCNLRILIISCDVHFPFGLKCLPSSLKILEWKRYPLKYLPPGFHLNELVDLKMPCSKMVQLWAGKQMSNKLKYIDLSHSKDLVQTPDFSMVQNLEKLVLKGCVKLVEVHQSVGQLKKLVTVNLKGCKTLKTLPRRLEMDSLKEFILSGCSKVKQVPEFGENMKCLLVLDLKNCKSLGCLPSSLGNLKSLKILNIFGCSKFLSLPNNLDENKCLEKLDVSGTVIREIPSCIIGLRNLKELYLNDCRGLSLTPNSLWNLLFPFQRVFGFSSHEAPMRLVLHPSISSLSSLRKLGLRNCNLCAGSIPDDLGRLPSLEVLDLRGNNFGSWVLPPSFSKLSSLREFYLSRCNLCAGSVLDNLGYLPSLEVLYLNGNNFGSWVLPPSFSNLSSLRTLHLSHCNLGAGSVLDYLGCLPSLEVLNLSGNNFGDWVLPPSFSNLSSLKEFDLNDCNLCAGSVLDNLGCLPSLEVLDLSSNNFGSWVLPPSFLNLSSLRRLYFSDCNLCDGSIPNDLSSLSSLSMLFLSGNNFTNLPVGCVSNLLSLELLYLGQCQRLRTFPDLPPNLTDIDANGCYSMEPLSFLEQLTNFIASSRSQVSCPRQLIHRGEFFTWRFSGSEIPSWFHNQSFHFLDKIDGLQDKSFVQIPHQSFLANENGDFRTPGSIVSIKVDVSHFCGSSESCGISLCLVLQCMASAKPKRFFCHYLWLTSKGLPKEFSKRYIGCSTVRELNQPELLIMFLPCNDVRADCNQVELIFYTEPATCWIPDEEQEDELKPNPENPGKLIITNCGWRVTSKEDLEEWRRTKSECSTSNNVEEFANGKSKRCRDELEEGDTAAFDAEIGPDSAQRRKLQ